MFPLASRAANKRIDRLYIIYDMKNVNITKLFDTKFQKFLQLMTNIVQDFYPELLAKLFVVNANILMKSVWMVVKPWLDKKTRDKIEFHTGVPIETLEKYYQVKNLPICFGGSNIEPLRSNHGPWKADYDNAVKTGDFKLKDKNVDGIFFILKMRRKT